MLGSWAASQPCDGLRLCFRQAVTVITTLCHFLLSWHGTKTTCACSVLGSLSSLHPNVSILEVQMISCVYVVIFYIIGCSGYIWKSIAGVLLRQGFTLVQTDSECMSSKCCSLSPIKCEPLWVVPFSVSSTPVPAAVRVTDHRQVTASLSLICIHSGVYFVISHGVFRGTSSLKLFSYWWDLKGLFCRDSSDVQRWLAVPHSSQNFIVFGYYTHQNVTGG